MGKLTKHWGVCHDGTLTVDTGEEFWGNTGDCLEAETGDGNVGIRRIKSNRVSSQKRLG